MIEILVHPTRRAQLGLSCALEGSLQELVLARFLHADYREKSARQWKDAIQTGKDYQEMSPCSRGRQR